MTIRRRRVAVVFAAAAMLAVAGAVPATARARQARLYDLVIAGGLVIDGSGRAGTITDVAIKGGRIAVVGRVPRSQAAQTIDASHLVVAPGFVDVHTHADNLVERPAASNFVRMGVTTIVAGNCGTSALDVGAALADLRDHPAAINFARKCMKAPWSRVICITERGWRRVSTASSSRTWLSGMAWRSR